MDEGVHDRESRRRKRGQVEVQTDESIIIENNDASVEEVTVGPTLPEPSPESAQTQEKTHPEKHLALG